MYESVGFSVRYLPLFITILCIITVIGILIWGLNGEHNDSWIWLIYIELLVLFIFIFLILLLSYWLCYSGYLVVAWILLIIVAIIVIGFSINI